ncbi:MAG: lamin tail domain-containing protein [Phycisphaerales bacterium]
MKRMIGLLFAGLACSAAQAQVKISAIYGGGSSSSATFLSEFQYDFIELKNNSNSAVTLTGHSLQYRGGTSAAFTGKINLPSITIPANGFFLIRTEPSQSGTCNAAAPCRPIGTPDFTASTGMGGSGQIQLSGTNGVVALVNTQTLITTPACIVGNPAVLDLVGFGNETTGGTTCFEGSGPTGAMGNQFVSVRLLAGCTDTDNNAADFTIQSSQFTPRNTASAPGLHRWLPLDCDNDTLCDRDEINAAGGVGGIGGTLDCNSNGQLDSCEITTNPQIDCDGNGQIDARGNRCER